MHSDLKSDDETQSKDLLSQCHDKHGKLGL